MNFFMIRFEGFDINIQNQYNIKMIIHRAKAKSYLFLLIVIIEVNSLCEKPQKSIYFSFNSLSNRDHIEQLFDNISKQTAVYSIDYYDQASQKNYNITQLKYRLSYNNHYQLETYLDDNSIRVRLGVINLLAVFNYTIADNNHKILFSGKTFARSYLDPSFFYKELLQKDGYVEWQVKQFQLLSFTALWVCEKNQRLPESELHMFQKMLNNIVPIVDIRSSIELEINLSFKVWLKNYLNSDHLFSTKYIPYSFKNISLPLTHEVQNITVSYPEQGLVAFLTFGLNDREQKDCGVLPQKYNEKEYGGVVEFFTLNSIKFIVFEAISRGLFNLSLDSTWETNVFQFFMGDLGNVVPYADQYEAISPIGVKCNIQNTSKIVFAAFDSQSIYLQLPERCVVSFKQQDLLSVDLQLILVAKLRAENQYLSVRVGDIYSRKTKFQAIDPKFVAKRPEVGEMIVQSILGKIKETQTLGTKIPLLFRKYPSLFITAKYLVIFDSSEFNTKGFDSVAQH